MENFRPRSLKRCSRITATVTPRIAQPANKNWKENIMKTEIPGITRANEGMQGISWNILGQTYVPKHCSEHSFSWHATFPPDTFVPPHIHPDQDEYLYILEG